MLGCQHVCTLHRLGWGGGDNVTYACITYNIIRCATFMYTWRQPQSLQQKVQSGVKPMRFKWAFSMWRHWATPSWQGNRSCLEVATHETDSNKNWCFLNYSLRTFSSIARTYEYQNWAFRRSKTQNLKLYTTNAASGYISNWFKKKHVIFQIFFGYPNSKK